jgi:hypothetical protein
MASTSLHYSASVSLFLHGDENSFVAWLDWVNFLLHGGAVSARMNGCPLAASCEVFMLCLDGSLDMHGFCMVSRPCIDDPLRLGF